MRINKKLLIGLCIIILAISFVTAQTISTSIHQEYKDNKIKCKDKTKDYLKNMGSNIKACEYTDTQGKTWIVLGGN